ncbi:methylated-DNA--[protein]-cysteine S-methyltransferase [Longispora albida]|uniref:methylated-DNA--[protein]-cysteine S-methyltransferase n=1 Tax=Longispora albida TaxID=203523 RepID=UPI00036ECDE5|nr:methylated-DNA--[protein]-cysteine S-methyltransferase [Longispora albida]
MSYATIVTPAGPFTTIADNDGAVLASGFTTDTAALLPQVHKSLLPEIELSERAELGEVTEAVVRYFDGEVTAIDKVPVRLAGGEFLVHARQTLRTVTTPVTYTELAELSGRPSAVRAAAMACAGNPAALFVPCHRVVRIGGALAGFLWGLDVKRHLLGHEAAAYTV